MGNIPLSPHKSGLQISVSHFSFIVSQKISQKCIKYCESTARNSKELHHALITKFEIYVLYANSLVRENLVKEYYRILENFHNFVASNSIET